MSENVDIASERVTRQLIGERPNTYTFTKAIAEQLVNEERGELPICIVRPSIVCGAIEEPMPGWVDNYNGPMGLVLSGAHGMCRSKPALPQIYMRKLPLKMYLHIYIRNRLKSTNLSQMKHTLKVDLLYKDLLGL